MDTPALEILRTQREDLARRVQSIDDAIAKLDSRATNRVRTAAPAGVASQARGKARSRSRASSRTRQGQAQQAPAAQSEPAAAAEAPASPAPLKDAVMATLAAAREGMTAKDIAAALTAQGRATTVNTVLSTLSRLRSSKQAEKRDGGKWFAAG